MSIDLSTPYANRKNWSRTWANHYDKISHILLDVSEFSKPHVFALAELAFFAAESLFFARLDRGNPIVLARDYYCEEY